MTPLHCLSGLGIVQRGGGVGMTRLRLHIRHRRARIQPLRDVGPAQIMWRQVTQPARFAVCETTRITV